MARRIRDIPLGFISEKQNLSRLAVVPGLPVVQARNLGFGIPENYSITELCILPRTDSLSGIGLGHLITCDEIGDGKQKAERLGNDQGKFRL